jgi:hypothetical protein
MHAPARQLICRHRASRIGGPEVGPTTAFWPSSLPLFHGVTHPLVLVAASMNGSSVEGKEPHADLTRRAVYDPLLPLSIPVLTNDSLLAVNRVASLKSQANFASVPRADVTRSALAPPLLLPPGLPP